MNLNYILKIKDSLGGEAEKSYYYPTTRARALISKLLEEEDYAKLMKMDINETLRFLEEGEYKKEIDAVGIKAAKMEQMERVLNENFASSVNKLLRFTPLTSPIWAYIMKYDISNIKTILRGKVRNTKKDEVWQKLVPVGSFSKEYLKSLVDADKKTEIIEKLRGTPYYNTLKENAGKSQEELEDALDRYYFKMLLEQAKGNKALKDLVRIEIDIRNVLTLLRLKKTKIQNIERFFINGGSINIEKLKELARLDEFEIINSLKKYKFAKYMPTNTKELDKLEAGLRKYLYMQGWGLKKGFKPSSEALLGYIFGKEREISNVRILARSKTVKSPEDALNIRSKLYVK